MHYINLHLHYISRLQVQITTATLSGANLGKLFMHVPLTPTSINW